MFTDDQLLPISALQHFVFCQRRAALVHIEGLWSENRFTAEGNETHRRVHDPKARGGSSQVRSQRGLELRSYGLGLTGKADLVEFRERAADNEFEEVMIVEYKRGKARTDVGREFEIQVCAQALCLEEMIGRSVNHAAIFYALSKKRVDVPLSTELRDETHRAIAGLHAVIASEITPLAKYEKKCGRCSLLHLCLPKSLRLKRTAAHYLSEGIAGTAGAELND